MAMKVTSRNVVEFANTLTKNIPILGETCFCQNVGKINKMSEDGFQVVRVFFY